MKKFVLMGMMLVGAMAFAAKITTKGRTWEQIMNREENEQQYGGTWIDHIKTFNGYPISDKSKFVFAIYKSENDNKWYLNQIYQNKESAKGDEIIENEIVIDEEKGEFDYDYSGDYNIYPTNKKGIYYVNNYFDYKGKKYPKLYFGFDEKLKKVVVTDKDGNILEKLDVVFPD